MMRIGVAAIFKNERPYILEWVAHYRALGFDEIIVFDNDSNDDSGELLAALARDGVIVHEHFPTGEHRRPQHAAYAQILETYGPKLDWLTFLDCDEFLIPSVEGLDIHAIMREYGDDDIGAVAMNWATYGSSGNAALEAGLVMERFTERGPDDWGVNRHIKTIMRPQFVTGMSNPHYYQLSDGKRYVTSRKDELVHGEMPGLSHIVCWDTLRINHYVVKSYGEFLGKKSRGRATDRQSERDDEFFRGHDRNETHDPVPLSWIDRVKLVMSEISPALLTSPN